MERKFILNYSALDNYLTEGQKNPHRTDGQLTLLRDNCKNNLTNILGNPKECEIVINESNGEIIINGEKDLQNKFYTLPSSYPINKKDRLYQQLKQALEEAKNRGIYNEIFTEVKESE